jgi:hypothetical protein
MNPSAGNERAGGRVRNLRRQAAIRSTSGPYVSKEGHRRVCRGLRRLSEVLRIEA